MTITKTVNRKINSEKLFPMKGRALLNLFENFLEICVSNVLEIIYTFQNKYLYSSSFKTVIDENSDTNQIKKSC